MRAPVTALLLVGLVAAGCGHYGQRGAINAAANVALAATVLAAQAAAGAAAVAQDRDRPSLTAGPVYEKGKTPCARNTSHTLYCTMDDERCFFRTSYGTEFNCSVKDCSDGPPAALTRWCDGD
jgi:hypothetical protein